MKTNAENLKSALIGNHAPKSDNEQPDFVTLDHADDIALDEADIAAAEYRRGYREAAEIAVEYLKNLHRSLLYFQGDARLAIKSSAAANNFWTLLTEKDQRQIAEFYGCTRANVNKLIILIQTKMDLPPMFGQRGLTGRKNMTDARNNHIKTK